MKLRLLGFVSMLYTSLISVGMAELEEPPLPPPPNIFDGALSPLIFTAIIIGIIAFLTWKMPKLLLPFIGTVSAMAAGFLLGLAGGGMGLAMLGANVGIAIAIAILAIGMTLKRKSAT